MVRDLAWRAAYAALFVAAGFLGRATIVDGHALSLVWPAAGVAVVWFLHQPGRRSDLVNAAILALASLLVNRVTGSSTAMALVFMVANLVQVGIVVAFARRWGLAPTSPDSATKSHPLSSAGDLARFLLAASLGCLAGVACGATGLWLADGFFSWDSTLVWWGRNVAGVLGVASFGLLLVDVVRQQRAGRPRTPEVPAGRHLELLALSALTLAIFLLDYVVADLPVSFLLPALTAWAGLRFGSLVVATHALVGGSAFIAVTLLGHGPFIDVDSLYRQALLAQVFVGMTVMLGLFLAATRTESLFLQGQLAASERESAAQATVLATVIRSLNDGVVVVDADHRISLVNRAAERALGALGHDLLQQQSTVFSLYAADGTEVPYGERPSVRALHGEVAAPRDLRLSADPHGDLWSTSGTPLTDEQGRTVGAVVVFHDVTREREREEQLAAFAKVAAHDLRSPLTVLTGWSEELGEMIEAAPLSTPQRAAQLDALGRIHTGADRMRTLVEELLAKATDRDRSMVPAAVDLAEVVADLGHVSAGTLVMRGLPTVWGDRVLLQQVFANLIANATTYVGDGETPRIEIAGRVDGDQAIIEVADRGIGIPDGLHEAIFTEYVRAHPEHADGTGLGLALCRRIVERHGGTLVARGRTDGPGSVFTLSLPLPAGHPGQDTGDRAGHSAPVPVAP